MVEGGRMKNMDTILHVVEYVKDSLYFVALPDNVYPPAKQKGECWVSIDKELVYCNFFLDFGPLNLAQTYRFCEVLGAKRLEAEAEALEDSNDSCLDSVAETSMRRFGGGVSDHGRVYFYSSTHENFRTNAATLLCIYGTLILKRSPEEAWKPFENYEKVSKLKFAPFHDPTPFECNYKLSILDCVRGITRAAEDHFFNIETFNLTEYESLERVENGDLNWITNRFIAFAGPKSKQYKENDGFHARTPEDYIGYFRKNNVRLVIRLNKPFYDPISFTKFGFLKHADLLYPDGTTPSRELLNEFLRLCEEIDGNIAVHCKAGLGRTGSCIGCYVMKHYGWTAAEFIGWIRIARPGSVIGPQQQWLESMEKEMWAAGKEYKKRQSSTLNDKEESIKTTATTKLAAHINTATATMITSPSLQDLPHNRSGDTNLKISLQEESTCSPIIARSPGTPARKARESMKAQVAASLKFKGGGTRKNSWDGETSSRETKVEVQLCRRRLTRSVTRGQKQNGIQYNDTSKSKDVETRVRQPRLHISASCANNSPLTKERLKKMSEFAAAAQSERKQAALNLLHKKKDSSKSSKDKGKDSKGKKHATLKRRMGTEKKKNHQRFEKITQGDVLRARKSPRTPYRKSPGSRERRGTCFGLKPTSEMIECLLPSEADGAASQLQRNACDLICLAAGLERTGADLRIFPIVSLAVAWSAVRAANVGIAKDEIGAEKEALQYYKLALQHVLVAADNEDNKISRKAMVEKFNDVMARAEQLTKFMECLDEAKKLGSRAVDCDNLYQWNEAIKAYGEASANLIEAVKVADDDKVGTRQSLLDLISRYVERAEILQKQLDSGGIAQAQPLPTAPLAFAPSQIVPPAFNPELPEATMGKTLFSIGINSSIKK
eukprot:g4844.t1